jgi:hypothetical protein
MRNDFIFKNKNTHIFVGYPYGHLLDPYVVLSSTREAVG